MESMIALGFRADDGRLTHVLLGEAKSETSAEFSHGAAVAAVELNSLRRKAIDAKNVSMAALPWLVGVGQRSKFVDDRLDDLIPGVLVQVPKR